MDLGEPEPTHEGALEELSLPDHDDGGDLNLDVAPHDPNDIGELSFDTPAPAPPAAADVLPDLQQDAAAVHMSRQDVTLEPDAVAPAAPAQEFAQEASFTVPVDITARDAGQMDVTIPVRIALDQGITQVTINLRLVLTLQK
jgi:hypothetical protein